MKNGKFYASSGAAIRVYYLINDKLYVDLDDAEYIYITTNGRYSQRINENGSPLHEAMFHLQLDKIKYFRVTVVNSKVNKAFSHAYFTEDLK